MLSFTLKGLPFFLAVTGAVLGAGLMLAILHQTSNAVKRYLVITLTFLAGLFYFLEFFIPPNPATQETILLGQNLTKISATVGNAAQVVAGFTFLLGVYNLTSIHGNNLRRRRAGWPYSLAFFGAFTATVVFAFWKDWKSWFGGPEAPLWVNDRNPAHAALPHDVYTLLFEGLYRHLEATMFSILAFYIVSAAYRAFRIRSGEAAVLMVVALILMMGQVPLGMALTSGIPQGPSFLGIDWSILRMEIFSQYILTAINGPVQRAIEFGLGLGALAMALRIWLSLERGTYFGEEG
ncbi:MAG TPA: hypothetical protein VK689_09200 [Armatimonadota bacterium]|nr:hypothetical protein [Armatimonadota bacterium]